jgi:hypothetical protein
MRVWRLMRSRRFAFDRLSRKQGPNRRVSALEVLVRKEPFLRMVVEQAQ